MSARTYIANRKRSHMSPRVPTLVSTLAVIGLLPIALPSARKAEASRAAPPVAFVASKSVVSA
ncbi:MAG TPA: hypothetical protein VGF45_02545, partial [Polyangia bacterium]